jgi:uncharacterized protein involved in outer membrane biogenesis
MTDNAEKSGKKKYSIAKKIAAIVIVVVILYAVVGFLVLPPILKAKLQKTISDASGVTTTVKDVAVNPFALSVTVKGFNMNSGGKTLARFEELYVNFQLSSLFHRAYTFYTIRLTEPEGLVEILPDGSFNWSTIISAKGAQPSETPSEKEIMPILIQGLEIEKGRLDFSDLSQSTPFEANLFPIEISLENFSTRKDQDGFFRFAATLGEDGEVNWKGSLSVNPVRSRGNFELRSVALRALWKYMHDRVNFEVTNGSMDAEVQYTFDTGTDTTNFNLKEGSLTIKEFTLCEKGVPKTLISIPLATCQKVGVNLERNEVSIASITSNNARITGWRDRNGSINYRTLFSSPPEKKDDAPVSAPKDTAAQEKETWFITIDNLSFENYGIEFEDRMHATPVRVSFEPITLNIKNATNRKGSRSEIALNLKVNQTGTAEVKGTAGVDPQTAELAFTISGIALKPFQQYFDAVAKINLLSGTANLVGTVYYDEIADGVPKIRYRGKAGIDGFDAYDRVRSEDLLKWKSLVLNDMEVDVTPDRLSIADVVVTEPYAKVIIFPDGTVNLADVFTKKDTKERGATTAPQPPPSVRKADESKESMPININTIRISNGSVNFTDLALTPNFAAGIHNLSGTVKRLSSDSFVRADVNLAGVVDRYAPISVAGKINLLSPAKFADLALLFKNMKLTTLTPYSSKFAGYKIKKGKMSLDLDYKLEGKKLIGENKILLNKLTLGERVESPSATTLPVTLAIALLKDREGNIEIDLPVKGNIDDPEFSFGRLVAKALLKLINKVITSPFAALGSLLGGHGEDFNHIDFEYGSAELTPEQTEKLDTLARALYKRPSLCLEIRGIADRTEDRAVLAEKVMMRTLKKLKADELQAAKVKVPPAVDDIRISDEEYLYLLIKAYRTLRRGKPIPTRTDKEKPEDTARAMKRELIDAVTIEDIELQQLAKERAQQIRGYLIKNGTLENNRVLLLDVQINDASGEDKARIILSLSQEG